MFSIFRASDGKIAASEAMPVFLCIMKKYQETEGLKGQTEYMKGLKDDLQVNSNNVKTISSRFE